jgi:large subunit ribosomal protein L22
MPTRATLRHSGIAPTKVRQVLGLIRGLDVAEAREVLRFCERGAAFEVGKLLDSAVANAEQNDHLPPDELYVSSAWADEAPIGKRYRPRARGRGTRIRKRSSHVTIVVERYSDERLRDRAAREAASGTGAAAERRRRLTRRRRVAASTAAEEAHDHDHGDEQDEVAEDVTETVEESVDEAEAEETVEGTEETEAQAADDAEASDEEADDSDDEESE